MDLAILIYSIITFYHFPIEKLFKSQVNELIIFFLFGLFIPLYLFEIYYNSYYTSESIKLKKFALYSLIQILIIVDIVIPIPINEKVSETYRIIRYFEAGINAVASFFIFGALSTKFENLNKQIKKENIENTEYDLFESPLSIVIMILSAMLWFFLSIYFFDKFGGLIGVILSLITSPLVLIILIIFHYITSNNLYKNYLEPFLIGIMYAVLIDYIIYRFIGHDKTIIKRLLILFITGVFTIRLYILLEPPVKKSSIVTAIFSLGFLLYNIGIFF
jgi:hypothetical protein